MAIDGRVRALEEKEREVRVAIQKLDRAADAMEPALTCLLCLEPLRTATTFAPCGHSFCRDCAPDADAKRPSCPVSAKRCGLSPPPPRNAGTALAWRARF
jgi:hypothetical protein